MILGHSHAVRVTPRPRLPLFKLLLSYDNINYKVSEYSIGSYSHVTRISESEGFPGA